MMFFTRDWFHGDLTEEEVDRARLSYEEHLARILPSLPLEARAFAQGINVHDGIIQKALINRELGELEIAMCCGDLQVGYQDVTVVYEGVALDMLDVPTLRQIVNDPETEVLADEFHRTPDARTVHRLLFWPRHELSITFSSMRFERAPRGDRAPATGVELSEVPRRSV